MVTIDGVDVSSGVSAATAALVDGSHTVVVTDTDAAGNVGSASLTFTLDKTAPALAVTVDSVTSDNVLNIAEAGGSVSITGRVSGEYATGDTVTVKQGGTTLGTGTVDANGAFSIGVSGSGLTSGTLTASVTHTDLAGNVGTGTATKTYSIDSTAPGTPTITSGALTNDGAPVLTGTAEAGSVVSVTLGGATYTTTASAVDGRWVVDTGSASPASG